MNKEKERNLEKFWILLILCELFIPYLLAWFFASVTKFNAKLIFVLSSLSILLLSCLFRIIRKKNIFAPTIGENLHLIGWFLILFSGLSTWYKLLSADVVEMSGLLLTFITTPAFYEAIIGGLIVVFISKMWSVYRESIVETEVMAEAVKEQNKLVKTGLSDLQETLEEMKETGEVANDFTKSSFAVANLGLSLPWEEMIRFKLGEENEISGVLSDTIKNDKLFNGRLSQQIVDFFSELRQYMKEILMQMEKDNSSVGDYDLHLHTYLAMAKKYIELEKMTMSKDNNKFRYEYRTWFPFYAQIVREIVENLECHWGAKGEYKCEFYTLLPRTASQFFNIANSGTPAEWSTGFMEKFNKEFIKTNNIDYYRYFLVIDGSDKKEIICTKDEFESSLLKNILVTKNDGGITGAKIIKNQGKIEQLLKIDSEEAGKLWKKQSDKSARDISDQNRYFIVDSNYSSNKEVMKHFSQIKEIIPLYHRSDNHSIVRVLTNDENYNYFVNTKEENGIEIPKDLFAIKIDNKWKYCVGAFRNKNSDTVKIRVYTEKINKWDEFTNILNKLFIPSNNTNCYKLKDFLGN